MFAKSLKVVASENGRFTVKPALLNPRRADRSFDYVRGWSWYVGWAENGDRMLTWSD